MSLFSRYIPPIGDSAQQAGERLASVLSELGKESSPGKHIAVVTHGGLITDFLVHPFSERELHTLHPDFTAVQSDLIPECSITRLSYEGGQYTIDTFASVEHLATER